MEFFSQWGACFPPVQASVLACRFTAPRGSCLSIMPDVWSIRKLHQTLHTYLTEDFLKIMWLLATWDKAKIWGGAQSERSDSMGLYSTSSAASLLLLSVQALHLIKHHPALPNRVMSAESVSGDDWQLDGGASAGLRCPNKGEFTVDILI